MARLPISRLYLIFLGLVLFGYMSMDKGFAYLGLRPLFIGEIALALGFMVLLLGGFTIRVFRSPIAWVLIVFIMWNALRTIPLIDVYGLDAIQDGMTWAYSLYAILFASLLLRTENALEKVPEVYSRIFVWIAIVGLAALIITELFFTRLPTWPGTDTTIIMVKAGDLGVQIAGAIAFMAVGLHTVYKNRQSALFQLKEFYIWGILILGSLLVVSRSRGGFLGIAMACALIFMFRPSNRMVRLFIPLAVVGVLFVALDVRLELGGGRELSAEQVATNILSIFTEQDEDVLDTTEEWRLTWWTSIINDTLFGDRFWLGRGYGVSHAELDGFDDATGNRNPHNISINFLGRAGFPGLVIWLALILTTFWSLYRCYIRASRAGRKDLASINLWIMAWGLAYFVYASFEVYLEGPQGAIPFWALMGFAIAATEAQRVPMGARAGLHSPVQRPGMVTGQPAFARRGGRSGGGGFGTARGGTGQGGVGRGGIGQGGMALAGAGAPVAAVAKTPAPAAPRKRRRTYRL